MADEKLPLSVIEPHLLDANNHTVQISMAMTHVRGTETAAGVPQPHAPIPLSHSKQRPKQPHLPPRSGG